MDIETVWNKIRLHEGEIFYKKKGGAYTYTVCGDFLIVNGIKGGRVTKANLAKALSVIDPTPRNFELAGCWGPSYVYGIITDERIKG